MTASLVSAAVLAWPPLARTRVRRLALPSERAIAIALVGLGLAAALVLRLWRLDAVGYNSDEAVYAGQAAGIAGVEELRPYFPIFRAHPLLFQTLHSLLYRFAGSSDLYGRLLATAFGLGTIALVFQIGRLLYGRRVGWIAAILVGLMPYHVLVSRQVLLDGPTTFFATLSLYFLALFPGSRRPWWLYAAGGAMGLAVLTKETSILMVGAVYVFFALSPEVGARVRHLAVAFALMAVTIAPWQLAIRLAGTGHSGTSYVAYQLFRRPNHGWSFYPTVVPVAIGLAVCVAAVAGLWLLRRQASWRETLLLSWIVCPTLFYEIYPVKGFQYLLPTAPAAALLAARTLGRWPARAPRVGLILAVAAAVSLALPTWQRIQPSRSGTFLAGSGGVVGGRELGRWIRANVPAGATFLTVGPSMANIVEFYGHRRAYGLSVGTNPLRRNPAYDPLPNPDLAIRTSDVQYVVWDAYSGGRTAFFTDKLLAYVRRYNGRAVHTESVAVTSARGRTVHKPLIVVYAVRP